MSWRPTKDIIHHREHRGTQRARGAAHPGEQCGPHLALELLERKFHPGDTIRVERAGDHLRRRARRQARVHRADLEASLVDWARMTPPAGATSRPQTLPKLSR